MPDHPSPPDLLAAVAAAASAQTDLTETPGGAMEMLSAVLGGEMAGAVAEISRRRLAAARYQHEHHRDDFSEMSLQLAEAEYRDFGGDPATVAADWVFAWRDSSGWGPVPVAHATFDEAAGRYVSTWDDNID